MDVDPASQFFIKRTNCSANSLLPRKIALIQTKARTTKRLLSTAHVLLKTVAAIIDPCSVKAYGKYLIFFPLFKVTNSTLEGSPEKGVL